MGVTQLAGPEHDHVALAEQVGEEPGVAARLPAGGMGRDVASRPLPALGRVDGEGGVGLAREGVVVEALERDRGPGGLGREPVPRAELGGGAPGGRGQARRDLVQLVGGKEPLAGRFSEKRTD